MMNNFSMYHFFEIGNFFLHFPPHKLTSRLAVYVKPSKHSDQVAWSPVAGSEIREKF
jgi:hypothetical protein